VRLLDLLERDYSAVYPDDPGPMDEGYESALRRLLGLRVPGQDTP